MAPIVFVLLSLFSFSADTFARKLLEPLPALPSKKLLQEDVKPSESLMGQLMGGRVVVEVKVDGATMNETYIPFFEKDYIPQAADQLLKVQNIKGWKGSKLVDDLTGCGKFCSESPDCNVASYYIEGSEFPGGKNCYLKTASFMESNLTSCTAPADAEVNPDAVLLFLQTENCADTVEMTPGDGGSGNSTSGTGGAGSGPKQNDSTTSTGATTTTSSTHGQQVSSEEAGGQETDTSSTIAASAASPFHAVGISSFFIVAVALLM